eukprot:scaffold319_cov97-Cylindrotheca_fusiformis.AAC.6
MRLESLKCSSGDSIQIRRILYVTYSHCWSSRRGSHIESSAPHPISLHHKPLNSSRHKKVFHGWGGARTIDFLGEPRNFKILSKRNHHLPRGCNTFRGIELKASNRMRKRKISNGDEGESTGSEMEVDGEEKIEQIDDSDDDEDMEEEEETPRSRTRDENPFLDSFYGLSSGDARERSEAAQTMLHQCLLGPNANMKDASYALRRLLNGLCSGRAAARQGNASALASFLKISFHLQKVETIQLEMNGENEPTKTPLSFIRERLLVATDPTQISGKKKGSEERDYQFGRLFGILALVRSNVLLPNDDSDLSAITAVASDLLSDLADLFWLKKWMREPAAHGMTTLLKLFYEGRSKEKCKKVLDHVVSHVVIPKILVTSTTGSDHKTLLESFCAEQIGIACFIQSHVDYHTQSLAYPLSRPTLSVETVPLISKALAETSAVVQPRTHFVWDSIWCYLFETGTSSNSSQPKLKVLRKQCTMGDDSAVDLVEAILGDVVMKRLLGIDNEKGSSASKATHERRSLAMCIVKNISGVPFMSSLSGPICLFLGHDAMENIVLAPAIVRRLFLDVICAGKQNKKQSSHLLKPLAIETLSAISAAVVDENAHPETNNERRLACVRALLKAEVRFDTRTKTSTIADLVGFADKVSGKTKDELSSLWTRYFNFLEAQFLDKCSQINESTAEATGYIELMYSAAKGIIRMEAEDEDTALALKEYKDSTIRKAIDFLMAAAFFDCSEVDDVAGKRTKRKKGKKKAAHPEILNSAALVKSSSVPYAVRSVISLRFFSLISDFVHNQSHQKAESSKGTTEKDSMTLLFLSTISKSWKTLESSGAKTYDSTVESEKADSPAEDVHVILQELEKSVAALTALQKKDPDNSLVEAKKRCCTGIAVLAHTLYLHRLRCGTSDEIDIDNLDADGEDDEEEICSALEGLKDVTEDFLGDGNDDDSNPLLGLSESCANILSSPLGSGDIGRGASPKLVREAVKFAWLGGLRLASVLATEDRTLLDNEVVDTLIDAIGASGSTKEDEMDDDDVDGASDSDEEDEDSESDEENVFAKATNLLDDSEHMEEDVPETKIEEESDVEVDETKLQSMLEEESDASVSSDILEHHEGADAALAKLIKLKQGARKAGKLAREKIEISNQLRCTFLLDLLFGRPDAWSNLFRSDIVLRLLLPMLKHRKTIEKSLDKATENRAKSGFGERRALLDKLTSLLKLKICKLKLSSMPFATLTDVDTASTVLEGILGELKRTTNKDHASCCSAAIVFVLRTIPTAQDAVTIGSALGAAVEEWSTKRTTRLESSLFDHLIEHVPR